MNEIKARQLAIKISDYIIEILIDYDNVTEEDIFIITNMIVNETKI
jgi:hypothetical protein